MMYKSVVQYLARIYRTWSLLAIVHLLPSPSLYDGDDGVAGKGDVAPFSGR